jgi:hypothetical protein
MILAAVTRILNGPLSSSILLPRPEKSVFEIWLRPSLLRGLVVGDLELIGELPEPKTARLCLFPTGLNALGQSHQFEPADGTDMPLTVRNRRGMAGVIGSSTIPNRLRGSHG